MQAATFSFAPIERVIYGVQAAQALRDEAARLGARRVFLMASGTMNRTTDEVARVAAALGAGCAGVYDRMPPHTPRDAVLEAAAAAREAGADLIATFGGGSLTDAGKMVQLCLRHDVRAMDDFDRFRVTKDGSGHYRYPDYEGPTVRQIAIPTTLSGGEFNPQCSCTDPRIKVKHTFRHPLFVPRTTLYDPAPTVHTPLDVWLSTGMRAVDHCVEGICAKHANPVNDGYAIQGLRLLARHLPRVKSDPADLDARQQCQFAVWLSMGGSSHLGVAKGISHAIGHILGGTCDVPHGVTSCLTLAAALRYNRPVNAERQRIVAEALGRPEADAADLIEALVCGLGLPNRLSQAGVGRDQFARIARETMLDPYVPSNPRPITSPAQVEEILEMAA